MTHHDHPVIATAVESCNLVREKLKALNGWTGYVGDLEVESWLNVFNELALAADRLFEVAEVEQLTAAESEVVGRLKADLPVLIDLCVNYVNKAYGDGWLAQHASFERIGHKYYWVVRYIDELSNLLQRGDEYTVELDVKTLRRCLESLRSCFADKNSTNSRSSYSRWDRSVYEYVVFCVDDRGLTIRASSGDYMQVCVVPNVTVDGGFKAIAPYQELMELVWNLEENDPVILTYNVALYRFRVEQRGRVKVLANLKGIDLDYAFSILNKNYDSAENLARVDDVKALKALLDGVSHVRKFAGKSDKRSYTNSIRIEFDRGLGRIALLATDLYSMSVKRVTEGIEVYGSDVVFLQPDIFQQIVGVFNGDREPVWIRRQGELLLMENSIRSIALSITEGVLNPPSFELVARVVFEDVFPLMPVFKVAKKNKGLFIQLKGDEWQFSDDDGSIVTSIRGELVCAGDPNLLSVVENPYLRMGFCESIADFERAILARKGTKKNVLPVTVELGYMSTLNKIPRLAIRVCDDNGEDTFLPAERPDRTMLRWQSFNQMLYYRRLYKTAVSQLKEQGLTFEDEADIQDSDIPTNTTGRNQFIMLRGEILSFAIKYTWEFREIVGETEPVA